MGSSASRKVEALPPLNCIPYNSAVAIIGGEEKSRRRIQLDMPQHTESENFTLDRNKLSLPAVVLDIRDKRLVWAWTEGSFYIGKLWRPVERLIRL